MSDTELGVTPEAVTADYGTALAMIRAANSVGSPLPWANALAAWPGGSGFDGSTSLRWAVEDLVGDGLVVATTKGLLATALVPGVSA